MRRGIEPIVAEVILIVVAIAIAIAFASWMFGFWNVHSTSHTQGIQFYPDSYVSSNREEIYLHLKTHMDPAITFYVDVPGYTVSYVQVSQVIMGDVTVNENNEVTAKIGSEFWLKVVLSSPLSDSDVKVKIYSDKGYVYWYTVHS